MEEQLNTILEENNLRSVPPPAALLSQNNILLRLSNQDSNLKSRQYSTDIHAKSHLEENCIKPSNHYRQQSSHLIQLLYRKRSEKAFKYSALHNQDTVQNVESFIMKVVLLC